jgi:hypothetical protein
MEIIPSLVTVIGMVRVNFSVTLFFSLLTADVATLATVVFAMLILNSEKKLRNNH